MGKLIVVTGGAGFVGSHLCRRLQREGHRVISLDNYFTGSRDNHVEGVEYREGHTKDIATHVPETPDLIFHLGEYSRVNQSFSEPEVVLDLNVAGTIGVVNYWREKGCKLVYAGSSTKFGDAGAGPTQSPYAWTKDANTKLVASFAEWYGLPFAITYFYNVYGPGERADTYGTVIEIFRQRKLKGEPLRVNAPGTQRRNFTHVDDIIEGLVLVGEQGEGDGYAIGNEASYSILEVAELIGGEIEVGPPAQGDRLSSSIDVSKTVALGWTANKTLPDYIKEVCG